MRICLVLAIAVLGCGKGGGGTPCDGKANGRFELHRVDNDADYMKQLFSHVGSDREGHPTDPAAVAANIRAEVDQWRMDEQTADGLPTGGKTFTDYYLAAPSASAIEPYLKQLGPAFSVPTDRRLVLESVATQWRTYYVDAKSLLDESAFASALVVKQLDHFAVMVTLTSTGAATFEQVTRANRGRKLAILVGGTVAAAPIINAAIAGGHFAINADTEAGAEQLAKAVGCAP